MLPSRSSLVLGAAIGYGWTEIAPFVLSLRRTGCDAQVVLLVGRIDAHTRKKLEEHAVTPVYTVTFPERLPRFLAGRLLERRRLSWLHRSLPRLPGTSANSASPRNVPGARSAAWFHHPMCGRYLHCYRFLRTRSRRYDRVLLTDVRDVFFQADPFAADHSGADGVVCMEHSATHGDETFNDGWIEICFGADGLAALRGRRVVCAGTTLAKGPHMLAYLAAMRHELIARISVIEGRSGVDQAIHNWLFWTGRLPGFEAVENAADTVLTMHGMPSSLIRADSEGRIVSASGRVIPVLHQYDRHPDLASRLLRSLVPPTS